MGQRAQENSLRRSITVSAAWMVSLRVGEKFLGLISSIVVARLLLPEDFGLIALATSLYALIKLIRDCGFGVALIQNQSASRAEYDTAWTLQLLLSISAAFLLVLLTGYATAFYSEPRLSGIIYAYAVVFVISGFMNIGAIQFQKEMTFDKVFWLQITPKLIGAISSICLAFYLRSYWALMIAQIIFSFCGLILSYTMHPYRPRFSLAAWRSLLGFSSWLMINNAILYIDRHGRHMVIAKIGGPQMLGILTIATDFATIVSRDLIGSVNTATYPAYAKVAHNRRRLSALLLDMNGMIAVVAVPASIGLAALSPLFVPVLLGDKWAGVIDVVPPIAFASVFLSFTAAYNMVLMSLAKQKYITFFLAIRLTIFFPLMIHWTVDSGALGVANAMLVANLLVFPLYLLCLQHLLEISLRDVTSAMVRPFLASLFMYVVIGKVIEQIGPQSLTPKGLFLLAAVVALGGVLYCAVLFCLWALGGNKNSIESKIIRLAGKRLNALL